MLLQTTQTPVQVRPAQESDRLSLSNLFYFEPYVHRHLDWKRPLDWLGHTPFLLLEKKRRILATLICPPDPPGIAWVRGFAASNQLPPEQAWPLLWEPARQALLQQGTTEIAALCTEPWLKKILETNGFAQTQTVAVLVWEPRFSDDQPARPPRSNQLPHPRPMAPHDLPAVHEVDRAAFQPLWRNSLQMLELAYKQALYASVVETNGELLGYQISTPSPHGGHLARLAVLPRAQGEGLGYALVSDLLEKLRAHGATRVTVNTQTQNAASLNLYRKAHFQFTGQTYAVYQPQ